MGFLKRLFGDRGAAKNAGPACAKCGGPFDWPDSFKSGPIPIPAHVIDKAIYCATCKKTFCIQCVRGKCPECGGSEFKYVSPDGEPAIAPGEQLATSEEMEERDRGKHNSGRSQAYAAAVADYVSQKDAARGAPMSDFMRSSLVIILQKKTPSEIRSMTDSIRAAVARGEGDMKAFISALEGKELYSDIGK